jgi:hypothetical protein
MVAVVPETEQTEVVAEAKLTVSPELAVADRVTFAPTIWLPIVGKIMVWLKGVTTTFCVTMGADA